MGYLAFSNKKKIGDGLGRIRTADLLRVKQTFSRKHCLLMPLDHKPVSWNVLRTLSLFSIGFSKLFIVNKGNYNYG